MLSPFLSNACDIKTLTLLSRVSYTVYHMEFWKEIESNAPFTKADYKGHKVYVLHCDGLWNICIDSNLNVPLMLDEIKEIFQEFAPTDTPFEFVAERSVYQRVLLREEKDELDAP